MAGREDANANFRGWHFPEDPSGVGGFAGTVFGSTAYFAGAKFSGQAEFTRATFTGYAFLEGATFVKQAWFDDVTFSAAARFTGAIFSGQASFHNATCHQTAIFNHVTFSGQASFNRVKFSGPAWFDGAMFSKEALFRHAKFSEQAWFGDATFSKTASFNRVKFSGPAWFDGATFSNEVEFNNAMFGYQASFNDTTFSGQAWFDDVRFGKGALLSGATFSDGASFGRAVCSPGATVELDLPHGRRPFRHRRDGETAYRFAKQSAQAAGDYSQAGRYHYAEQCAIEDRRRVESGLRPWRPAFRSWFGRFFFARSVFGYGERPLRSLGLGLAVIIIWTALYAGLGAIAPTNETAAAMTPPHTLSVREALYFSVATFTSLAYGDFQPKPAYRLLAVSEAVLGAALMAVFIVCLTRKYMR